MNLVFRLFLLSIWLSPFWVNAQQTDAYAKFNKETHFVPEVSTFDFYRDQGFDFGWLILEPMSLMVEYHQYEEERVKRLSPGQKALYFWWYVDGQVTNGGFVQFYFNGYGKYMPAAIKGMEYIGDRQMANLLDEAHQIYLDNQKIFEEADLNSFSGLYNQLDDLGRLDNIYFEINDSSMARIEAYIRKHPDQFCKDEKGKGFDPKFSGELKKFRQNGSLRAQMNVKKGRIHGLLRKFHSNGNLGSEQEYKSGQATDNYRSWYENGNLKLRTTGLPDKDCVLKEAFYENGNKKEIECVVGKWDRLGEYKEWYENGVLHETGNYNDEYRPTGTWKSWHENGQMELVREYKKKELLFINGWNAEGQQVLQNGTGTLIWEVSDTYKVEKELQDYKIHGKTAQYRKGKLIRTGEFLHGKKHGLFITYDRNTGAEKEREVFRDDVLISE